MFGSLGGPEIVLIFIVALIVFGPKQLPEIGRKVGGLVREFRRATGDFRMNMQREIGFDPITGLEVTKKARRDILSSVSEPIREVAQGTIGAVREAGDEAAGALRSVKSLGQAPVPSEPEPGKVSEIEPGETSQPGPGRASGPAAQPPDSTEGGPKE